MEKLFKSLPPPPLDTGIPDKHDFIFRKKLTQQMGSCISGGTMSYTTFGTWGRGKGEGDQILKCYTFDLFTLSINIH